MDQACEERVFRYTKYLENALNQLKNVDDPKLAKIIDLAGSYFKDSIYYLGRGDICTSLSCISYAEGLLDCLGRLGLANFAWPKPDISPRKKVLVGGVFDIIHPGHIYFLKKAAELGKVYVVVARDSTVLKEKGRRPVFDEKSRVEVLNNIKWVYEAFLGEDPPDFKKVLNRVRPDIVFLGPDQIWLKDKIVESIKSLNLKTEIKVLDAKIGNFSSSKIMERIKRGR